MINLIEKIDGKSVKTQVEAPDFAESYDVAVIGLGAAGAISTIVSANKGLKTIGIERLNAAGGTITMGGICGYYFGGAGGDFERVDEKLHEKSDLVIKRSFVHPDLRKYNLDCELEDCGATVCFESVVTALYTDSRRVVGFKLFDGVRETDIAVKTVIDATGEGEICDMAGCSMSFGRRQDGSVVPFTISKSFIIDGRIEKTNHDSGKIDQRNPVEFSRAVLEGQSYFVKRTDGQKVVRLHSLPGVREGRLLNGEKKVTVKDFLNGKVEKEPVIYAYADLDKHGPDIAFDSDIFRKWDLMSNLGALNITVPIPKECLIAKEYDNLLVAGRSLSVDHEMQTCVRMNRDMQKLGEVAAILALISLEDKVALRNVKYERIEPLLRKTGCLSEDNNRGFWYDGDPKRFADYIRKAEWFTTAEEINENLSTLKPAVAIWSCRILCKKIKPTLIENLESEDENLRKHSAIALAVMDDASGLEVLRQIVTERDRTELQDMRKHNKRRIAMALCGLGLLKDRESIGIIKDVITDKREPEFYPIQNGFKEIYYRTVSIAVAALMDIANAYPEERPKIEEFLEKEFSSLEYIGRMTETGEYTSPYVMCKDIYNNISIWKNSK